MGQWSVPLYPRPKISEYFTRLYFSIFVLKGISSFGLRGYLERYLETLRIVLKDLTLSFQFPVMLYRNPLHPNILRDGHKKTCTQESRAIILRDGDNTRDTSILS